LVIRSALADDPYGSKKSILIGGPTLETWHMKRDDP